MLFRRDNKHAILRTGNLHTCEIGYAPTAAGRP